MNRHRVSSIIGSLGLSEEDQDLVYDHFGHSKDININVYQIPQAERHLNTTGALLRKIDKNEKMSTTSSVSENASPAAATPKSTIPKIISPDRPDADQSKTVSGFETTAKAVTFSSNTGFVFHYLCKKYLFVKSNTMCALMPGNAKDKLRIKSKWFLFKCIKQFIIFNYNLKLLWF